MKEKRPSPEELLKIAHKELKEKELGKLRIYLGAAPGVGKTYTMLQDAQMKRQEGLEVLVGVVESHGRKEIETLLKGFEILPRQSVEYRGIQLTEFDLDSALKRNPSLILIDEMAHTNAPGLRHEKRWQDIKELLDRGINVYTTVNVQHIESRKDDVAKIIHTHIKESVPDSMFEIADTIELVDLPPEDLIKRLHEGKVYFPEQIEIAKDNFFRIGNLFALREIALRYTADLVGADVLLYRQGQHIQQIWPTREKILVCVGPGHSNKLIRTAARIANSLQAEWVAIHVDTPWLQTSADDRNRAVEKLRLAEKLGAETRLIVGTDIVKEILAFAQEQNITQIIVWKSTHISWRFLLKNWRTIIPGKHGMTFSSLADKIVRNSGDINVYVMTGEKEEIHRTAPTRKKRNILWEYFFMATGICAATTLIIYLLFPILNIISLIMIYFAGVILVALYGKIWPTIYATLLSGALCLYLFLPPYYVLSISDTGYFFSLVLMLATALIVSYFTMISQRQASRARYAERQIALLHYLTRKLAKTRGIDKLLNIAVTRIAEMLDCEVLALLPHDKVLTVHARSNSGWNLDDKELSVAQWVYELGQEAGLGTDTLPFSQALYVPLSVPQGTIGVLSLRPHTKNQLLSPEQMRLLEAFANQLAVALEAELKSA